VTSHAADVTEDGEVRFDSTLTAAREPDGVAVTPDGRYLLTADEGDTEPKVSKVEPGRPAGGGRTLSVVDLATREVIGDTQDQLDRACADAGIYPDDRSDNKGCEPEMVAVLEVQGRSFAVVSLERADGLALVDLADPRAPRVVGVAPIGPGGPHAPEGIAVFGDRRSGEHFVYTANEESGMLGVARVGATAR
jgi:hypothetical protein